MSLETLNNISHALNISTDWILEGNLSLTETTSEIGKILEDCSEYERCRIFEAAREIRWLGCIIYSESESDASSDLPSVINYRIASTL
jgi:hypothetical protein